MKVILNLALFIVLTLTAVNSFAQQEITLTATAANTIASRVLINDPGLTNNPNAIIVATPLANTATLNPHPIGAWYYNNKWWIFNTGHANIPIGSTFKVQVFLSPDANHFLHIVPQTDAGANYTCINYPVLYNNPTAQIKIFQNHAPDNRPYSINPNEAEARYDSPNGKWCIKNVNGNPLYPKTAYNVVITSGGAVGSNLSPTSPPTPSTAPSPKTVPPRPPQTQSPNSPQRPCTEADEAQKEGSWRKQAADSFALVDASFPKEQYKPVLAKAQKVIELLKQANPQPTGIQADPQRFISGRPYTKNGAMPFGVTVRYFGFICMPEIAGYSEPGQPYTPRDPTSGQIVPNGETDTVVEVSFNSFGRMLNRSIGTTITAVNGDIMFFYPKETGALKGLKILSPGAYNRPQRDEAIIITSDNRPPLKPVTREQYLLAWAKLSRKKIKQLQEGQQQSPNPTRQAIIKFEENELARIESAIAQMSAAESQMQAVIGDDWGSGGRFFAPESEIDSIHSIRLVTIDKGFYDSSLPRQTIQLIVVYWSWNEKSAPKAELIRQFKQNFDFESLRQMLGK